MKKLYFLLFTILMSALSFGQGSESFTNSNATSTYADNSFIGDGGVTWSYVASRDANNDANSSGINLPALMLRRLSSGSKVTSSVVSGGIGDFSVKLYKGFTGVNPRQVELYVNNVLAGTSVAFDDFLEHTFTVSGVNVGGDVVIELRNKTEGQIIVDDITWTGYAGSGSPSLSISSPVDNSKSSSADVDIEFSTPNFIVGVDGKVKYNINSGSDLYHTTSDPISLTSLPNGAYTVDLELVDNSNLSLNPAVTASVNFTVHVITIENLPIYEGFNYSDGANLGDLGNWQNLNTGDEIIVSSGNLSYSGLPTSTGNMVSFNADGFDPYLEFTPITSGTVFASFMFKITDISAMTDLTDGGYFAAIADGTTSFDARIWVRPNPDAAGSTFDIGFGNSIVTPPNTSPTVYNVGDEIFAVISYDLSTGITNAWINPNSADFGGSSPAPTLTDTDSTPASSLSKFFLRQDSIDETPSMDFDELRIGTSWSDVTTNTLSAKQFDINGFKMYPNPTSLGYVNITSKANAKMTVAVYDVLGKQVLNQTVSNNKLDVSGLRTGLYIMKVSQDKAVSTRKLVIQ